MDNQDELIAIFREQLRTGHPTLTEREADRFVAFYGLVLKWNPRLHLTTLIQPADFLARHVDEVLFALPRLSPQLRSIWDLGSGLGVPGIPFAIMRPDLEVHLVEASLKKAVFLETLVDLLQLELVRVECRRIETLPTLPAGSLLTARAVEQMARLLPLMRRLAEGSSQLLIFCSAELAASVQGAEVVAIPGAIDRCLADFKRST